MNTTKDLRNRSICQAFLIMLALFLSACDDTAETPLTNAPMEVIDARAKNIADTDTLIDEHSGVCSFLFSDANQ